MLKRSINHLLRSSLPWLLVGLLGATIWLGTDLTGAVSALKRLLQVGYLSELINYQSETQ